MSPRVYLSPSGQVHNVGIGSYGTEEARCRKVAELTKKRLEVAGVEVDMTPRQWNTSLPDGTWLSRVVGRSNAFGAQAHVAIHSNAGGSGARGADAWHYPGSSKGARLTREICSRLAKVAPAGVRGVHTSPVFYETRHAAAPVAYLEIGFHTNRGDAVHIAEHPDLYADAIAGGILAFLGVKPKPSTDSSNAAPAGPKLVPRKDWPKLKDAMLTFALLAGIRISGWERISILAPVWRTHARRLAWRVSSRVNKTNPAVPKSSLPTRALFNALTK